MSDQLGTGPPFLDFPGAPALGRARCEPHRLSNVVRHQTSSSGWGLEVEELSVGHEPWALSTGNILYYSLILYHTTLMPDGHTHTYIYYTLYTFNYLALHYITSPYTTQITLHYITSCSVPFRSVALHTHTYMKMWVQASTTNKELLCFFSWKIGENRTLCFQEKHGYLMDFGCAFYCFWLHWLLMPILLQKLGISLELVMT